MSKPMTVEAAFEQFLEQVYGPHAADMDPQQRSDLRDFFVMGARTAFLTALNAQGGDPSINLPAFSRELRTACEDLLQRMAQRINTTGRA